MTVSVVWALTATVTEVLDNNVSGIATDAKKTLTYDAFNEGGTLNAGTTPPVTKNAQFIATLSSGALTLNFAALTGSNGATVDLTGLKVQILRVKNLGANNLVITEGASDGLALLGASFSVTIFPGASMEFMLNDAAPDVASGDRTVDLTGTGAQTSEWSVVAG